MPSNLSKNERKNKLYWLKRQVREKSMILLDVLDPFWNQFIASYILASHKMMFNTIILKMSIATPNEHYHSK